MRRFIFLKFLGIQLPVCVAIIAIGLQVLAHFRVQKAEEEFGARIGAFSARIASLVSSSDLASDVDAANRFLGVLLTDRGILCAELLHEGQAIPTISAPRRIGCKGASPSSYLEVPLDLHEGKSLRIGVSSAEVDAVRKDLRDFALLLSLSALLVVGLASGLAFRRVIGSPMKRLLAGIRATTQTGRASPVIKTAPDEIGAIVNAFNTMQEKLETESNRVVLARDRIDRLYNTTPALLFTMSEEGKLTSASDYWLEVAGYDRADVAGRHMSLFLSADSRALLLGTYLPSLRRNGLLREAGLMLLCKDGSERSVLFSAVCEGLDERGQPRFVCILSDITDLKTAEDRLKKLAWTDSLTGLPNRARLAESLRELVSMPRSMRGLSAVMMIDLDNFKWVNDTYGHAGGDMLLIEAARRISAWVRSEDMVARLGGDEFAVVVMKLESEEQANQIADAIIAALVEGIQLDNSLGYVSASIGITFVSANIEVSGSDLLRMADQAMYVAKRSGKNRHEVFSESHGVANSIKAERIRRIEQAMTEGWFYLVFQPIIDLRTKRPVGMEALLRLRVPGSNEEAIQSIIQVAEETGQIGRLGNWILREAARHYAGLAKSSGDPDFYLTVNLSVRQLTGNFVSNLENVLCYHPELVDHLILEITETAAVKQFDFVSQILNAVHALGVRIAIDDFGTGYSSLSYISRLPVDLIKLDRSFTECFARTSEDNSDRSTRQALARVTASLGRELGVPIIAEGIEAIEVADAMNEMGIAFGQGYVFAMPMPKKASMEWLRNFAANQQLNVEAA